MTILLGASLLAACAPLANANPTVPAVSTVVTVATVSVPVTVATVSAPVIATTVAPLAPLATSTPKSSPTSSTSPTTGNCTLLSKDEISKVLGEAVAEVRDPSKDHALCVYQTKNLILEMGFVTNFGGFGDSVKYMQFIRANAPAIDVPGLGDEALYNSSTKYIILLVRKGALVYSFGVRGVSGDYLSLADSQAKDKPCPDNVFQPKTAHPVLSFGRKNRIPELPVFRHF